LARNFVTRLFIAVAYSIFKRKEAAYRAKEIAYKKNKEQANFNNKFKEIILINSLEDVVIRDLGL
jgi:flagellar basal body rod protein FlgC